MHLSNMQQNKAGFQRPDTFELYLNVVLEFTNHSSQVSWFVTLGVQLIVKSRGGTSDNGLPLLCKSP